MRQLISMWRNLDKYLKECVHFFKKTYALVLLYSIYVVMSRFTFVRLHLTFSPVLSLSRTLSSCNNYALAHYHFQTQCEDLSTPPALFSLLTANLGLTRHLILFLCTTHNNKTKKYPEVSWIIVFAYFTRPEFTRVLITQHCQNGKKRKTAVL